MDICEHAYKRAKERMGLSKKAFDHFVEKALRIGVRQQDVKKGNFRKWLHSEVLKEKYKPKVIVHGSFLLIIKGETVTTVLPVPQNLLPIKRHMK